MFTKLLHIGIAVRNLDDSIKLFCRLLETTVIHREAVAAQKVNVAVLPLGDTRLELTEAAAPDSPIAKFIEKRGEGIHHLSFEVDDIRTELQRLEQAGFWLIDREPRLGADGYLVAFLHPKSTNGVLVELSQKAR